jgi:hypothetical protein
MSEDLLNEDSEINDQNIESTSQDDVEDFDQGGLLLKIATNGLSIPDYVKKLKEADILVAVDGEVYRDGPAKLKELFIRQNGQQSKWLLSLWRDGQIFDIIITMPIESRFGLATEQETEWAMEEYNKHVYGDFDSYQNYEIYKDGNGVCDVLSMDKDILAGLFPALWLLKYRLYPPLGAVLISYGVSYAINFFLFVITYIVLSRFIYVSQNNIMRSFTLFANKKHYMTIAGTNERDVSVIVKNIDPNNKIRFERHAVKKPQVIHKVIVKDNRRET